MYFSRRPQLEWIVLDPARETGHDLDVGQVAGRLGIVQQVGERGHVRGRQTDDPRPEHFLGASSAWADSTVPARTVTHSTLDTDRCRRMAGFSL